jgi:hypothetical protein
MEVAVVIIETIITSLKTKTAAMAVAEETGISRILKEKVLSF